MLNGRVLSKEMLVGFDKYKYNAVDTNPLSNLMQPFWNSVVLIIPRWIAPNLLTLSGFLLQFVNFIAMVYYDIHFYASSRDYTDYTPIPDWVWLMCAINSFLSQTLDAVDGKQARRTGTSGPLGELFDHGLDSWQAFFIPMALYSIFGRGEHGLDVFRLYLIMIGVMFCFVVTHAEKYITGILYIPWGFDFSLMIVYIVYLITFICGFEFWKFRMFGFSSAEWFEISMYIGFGLTLPITVWNIYVAYRNKTGKMLSLSEAIRPLISTVILFTLMVTWGRYSSYKILQRQPRIFFITTGTVFSNIACRLIIAQMSKTRCEFINWLLVPLFYIVIIVCFLNLGVLEFYLLTAYCVFITGSHIHFGILVVKEMCEHFKISAFII